MSWNSFNRSISPVNPVLRHCPDCGRYWCQTSSLACPDLESYCNGCLEICRRCCRQFIKSQSPLVGYCSGCSKEVDCC